MAALSSWRASRTSRQRRRVVLLFAVNGVLNAAWSALFFTRRRPDWGTRRSVAALVLDRLPDPVPAAAGRRFRARGVARRGSSCPTWSGWSFRGRAQHGRGPAQRPVRRPTGALTAAAFLLASCASSPPATLPGAANPTLPLRNRDRRRRSATGVPRLGPWRSPGRRTSSTAARRSAPRCPIPPHATASWTCSTATPARTDGLGLTVARYDIGGGADPDPRPCDRPPDHGLWPRADDGGAT